MLAFKQLDDVNATKDSAVAIYKKFVTDGSLHQVGIPASVGKTIADGLQPKFPSAGLFDDAIDHVIKLLKQELWPNFKESAAFRAARPLVHRALQLPLDGQRSSPNRIYLQVRSTSAGGAAMAMAASPNHRKVLRVLKRCIVVGDAADSDLVTSKMHSSEERSSLQRSAHGSQAGNVNHEHSTVLWIEPASGGCDVALRWGNTAGLSAGTHFVPFKEVFYIGDLEASFHAGRI